MKMKKTWKPAGIIIFSVFLFMAAALAGFPPEDEEPMPSGLPNQVAYKMDENWMMVRLDDTDTQGTEWKEDGEIQNLAGDAIEKGKYQEVSLPYVEDGGASGILIFKNTLLEMNAGLTIAFSSSASNVYVFMDGEMIYQYEAGLEAREEEESHENIVNLPYVADGRELLIALAPVDPEAPVSLGGIAMYTHDIVVVGIVGDSVLDVGSCLLLVMSAIIMFVVALIRKYTGQPSRGELFLGLEGLMAGACCLIGSDTWSIFYNVPKAYVVLEYFTLLIPLFLALYLDQNFHSLFPRRFALLQWFACMNAAVQVLLHASGVRALKEMVNLSAFAVSAACLAAIVSLIQYNGKKKNYQVFMSVLAMAVLLAGEAANAGINMVVGGTPVNMAGRGGMTVFGIIMAAVHIFQLSQEYLADAEAKAEETERQNIQLARAKQDADTARYEALAANQAKGKFLAHMSHEIRTPINAVLGMDEMILRETKEQNIKEYATYIYTAGRTLLSLVNDILDFSKIDSGKMEIVPVEYDVRSLIHDLSNMALQRAENKQIRFELEADREVPSRLYGDDIRLRQVLTNILTNAIKYTHNGTVWLRLQCRKTDETAVLRFEVEDTGTGIKEEDLAKLFAEFERIEEEKNRNIEGSGLGMNITIELLALLGSRLQVESTYGKGSKFYFELEQKIIDHTPAGDFDSGAYWAAESCNYNYHAEFCAPEARILVVDDNAVNRKVFCNLLKKTRIQITEAESGAECLELVRENHYDLIFLDHMMPEMDGVETLRHIKEMSDDLCRDTPVIMLTANAVSGAKERYLAEGFDNFLSKPIVPEKLEDMIKRMLPEELQQEADHMEEETALPQQDETNGGRNLPEDLPVVDGLDWQYAWLHLPDRKLLQYTVKEFYHQIDTAADKLERAYERIKEPGGLEQYRIQAHAMKGLAATVGIMPLCGVAKILEYAAKDGKIDAVMAVTALFLEEWRSYREKLQGVFGIGEEAEKEEADYPVIQALVEMVRLSVQEMDIDRADQLMEQLRSYKYPDEIERNIGGLAGAVANLDEEEAGRFADMLTAQMAGKSVKEAEMG